MSKVTKKDFFDYMSSIYHEKYSDTNAYKVLLEIMHNITDEQFLTKMIEMTKMTKNQRLEYRYDMAVSGKEYTPRQIDQYISMINYALDHID